MSEGVYLAVGYKHSKPVPLHPIQLVSAVGSNMFVLT